jgi:hypothetical protein
MTNRRSEIALIATSTSKEFAMTTLAKLVSFVDDGPWCGTKPPGHPPRLVLETLLRHNGDTVALNPQPEPPGRPELSAYLWQAVRLYQLGQIAGSAKAAGNVAEALTGAAETLFDDWCGTVPISVLIQWLLHHPPPPPPWLDVISQAVGTVLVATKAGGDLGKQLQGAAVSVIQGELVQAKAAARSAAA